MNLPFFAVKAYVPGGSRIRPKKNSKNAFRPVPVQKFTFPGEGDCEKYHNTHTHLKSLHSSSFLF